MTDSNNAALYQRC